MKRTMSPRIQHGWRNPVRAGWRRVCLGLICLGGVLAWAVPAPASPSSALREYRSGHYDQSLQEYKKLLEKGAEDPRLHFNAGAAAYRDGRFDEATNQFSAALSTPDLKLLESAYYNRGNSLFWLGEKAADPQQRTEAWEKALKDYELSLKLNAQDADARHNYSYVQKKLEELKKQQQQQSKQNQDKQDQNKQDQNQQQQQQSQNDQNKEQQKQQQNQQQQAQQNQSQEQQRQQDAAKQQEKQQQAEQQQQDKQQEQMAQKAEQERQQQQQSAASADRAKEQEKEREAAAAYAAAQMTPEQAKQLLDADKSEEMMLPAKPEGKPSEQGKPLKDW